MCPVVALMTEQRKYGIASRCNTRPDHQRTPRAVARHQATRPARAGKHNRAHGQKCCSSLRGGIAMDLNQGKRQKEERPSERCVQQQGKEIHPTKRA